jgi:hypothetical protein
MTTPAGNFPFIAPTGSAVLSVGSPYTILWNSSNILENVFIQLSYGDNLVYGNVTGMLIPPLFAARDEVT